MNDNFNLYAQYYDLLYAQKQYKAEIEYVDGLLKKLVPNAKSILEFGSGTGIHAKLLQEKGYEVFGLERSESMVEIAQKNGLNCKVADISNFKLDNQFDIVISLFHVVSYLVENEKLIQTFKNANNHLSHNGLFVFDVWYSPAVYEQKAVPRMKKFENEHIAITRIANPIIDVNKNVIDVNYTIFVKDKIAHNSQEFFESHPMRHFSIPEMELLAALAGFEIIKNEEFVTSNKPSENSWGVCFVLKKIKNL